MTPVGIIARADRGGLAQMTCELVAHVRPDHVLVIDLGPSGRGPTDLTRLAGAGQVWTATHLPGSASYRLPVETDLFFKACAGGTIYTAETWYDLRAPTLARQYGARRILHAMPELLGTDDMLAADEVWLPTPWMLDPVSRRLGEHRRPPPVLMPVPVAGEHFAARARRRDRAEVFYADGGGAFHDRNGLTAVLDACYAVDRPCLLYMRGGPYPDRSFRRGRVTVEVLDPVDRYWDAVPDEVDVALMPRRYGGLTLGTQEAAALGVPTLMTDLPPNETWTHPQLLVPTAGSYPARMKGGDLPVAVIDGGVLAAAWNRLADTPQLVADASARALDWAETLDWARWADRYAEALGR